MEKNYTKDGEKILKVIDSDGENLYTQDILAEQLELLTAWRDSGYDGQLDINKKITEVSTMIGQATLLGLDKKIK